MKTKSIFVVIMVFIATLGQICQGVPVEWSDANGGNDHFYEVVLVSEGIDWESANAAALEAGGYLATITSVDENTFVHNLAVSNPEFWTNSALSGPWLGGFQSEGASEPAGEWQWVTGETFSYTNWTINQPDNGNGGTENRLHFWDGRPPTPYAPTWNDLPAEASLNSYVVEYVPEPVTLLLLGLGGVFLRKRRC